MELPPAQKCGSTRHNIFTLATAPTHFDSTRLCCTLYLFLIPTSISAHNTRRAGR